MRPSTLIPFLHLAAAAAAAATLEKRAEPARLILPRDNTTDVVPGRYIVKMHANTSLDGVMDLLPNGTHRVYSTLLEGFAANLDEASLTALRDHPGVDYVEADKMMSIGSVIRQSPASWGLTRVSHREPGGPGYDHDDAATGEGVCAYVVDTGIDDSHPEFEGRALMVASFVQGSNIDDHGHGTHVAGIIGSKTYGVAKKTKIYGVKVLPGSGTASESDFIAGMDFIHQDVPKRDCPLGVVINMSTYGPFAPVVNEAARRLVDAGYFVSVCAGNWDADASNYSPPSEPSVCTVGGTTMYDERYELSNYGPSVNIMAPAVDILSTLPNGQTGLKDGTSMAAPHVAGLAASFASHFGTRAGPWLCDTLRGRAIRDVIKNQTANTVNLLAYNGANGW